ncbi:MAG: TonB-dependent receptor [Rhodospirillales bacterium]|nr:TonB-dependent receptor [Rhodospirillales bacterium]
MSSTTKSRNKSSLLTCTALLALTSGIFGNIGDAFAGDDVTANGDPIETIVVTGTRFNTDAAPAKASLETTEPQTIINRSYIENFVPPQADYVTILAIVPSLTGGDSNGPGLSDGGAKNTLRGLPDGNFAMLYDGVPFGDTNGPTHHNISYFPASTIGSIVVDRGPGNAGNLASATYGGTIKLFSQTLSADPQANGTFSFGSFDTKLGVLNGQSGDLDVFGTTTRVLVNLQGLESAGALTQQDVRSYNAVMKIETKITPDWTVTLFGDYSYLREHLDDNNGLTPAQVQVYGKDFSLQNTNPLLPTYYAYNYTTKATDLEYFHVNGNITDRLKIDNLVYTYAYWNHTFSPNSQTQTLAQINANTSGDNGTLTLFSNGTKLPNQLLAYDKENRYRVYGDIVRLSQDYDFGSVTGQVRTGAWFETQETNRFKYFFDANLCNANLINPLTAGGGAAASACGVVSGRASNGYLGFGKDDEHTTWTQYQPFLEIDIKPIEDLTITPGVKYVHWIHGVNAPIAQGSTCGVSLACPPFNKLGQNYQTSFITRDTLPFLTVNYKLDNSWSVYAEYAKGIYVPDIASFETKTPTATFPQAEKTTNYQLGTVFYADNFTFDADIYYIDISNNYVSQPCSYNVLETCYLNNGSATYKGIEGEGTYAFDKVLDFDLSGLSIFVNGALMSSKAGDGRWEPNAPKWTAAAGLLYKKAGWKFGLIAKITGPQYSDTTNYSFYKLPSYSNVTATVGYDFGNYEVGVNVDNVLNSRAVLQIAEAGGLQTNPATSLDQYIFQAPISAMATLKVHFGGSDFSSETTTTYAPPPVIAPAPVTAPKSYLVFFDFNKSDLTPQAMNTVDQAAHNAGPAHVMKLEVTGHTDTVGSEAYNMRLSRRRAESVAARLEKDGVPSSEIEIIAKGKRDLLVPTADGVTEPQNRRVHIVYEDGMTS